MASGRKGRLAVLVCGLEDRFLWRSKVERVVAAAAAAGHGVDVYAELVASGAQDSKDAFTPVAGQVKSVDADLENLPDVLERSIRDAGGRLVHLTLRPTPEDVRLPVGVELRGLPMRLPKYPPLTDPIGRNLLRRYQTAERLARLALSGREPYDFVLWTRDDDHWLGPLDLQVFLNDPKASGRVYSKGCLMWGGLNDKTLLFGRAAAEVMLARLFSDFWLPDARLERAKNAESFLRAFAEVKGVEPVAVPFGQLPTADSAFVRSGAAGAQPQLCQKEQYLCSDLPKGLGYEQPVLCGQVGRGEKSALVVVNYWVYPEHSRRDARSQALRRTLEALARYPARVRTLLVTNEPAPEADGLVVEQIVRPKQWCSPTMEDPLCMAWEAMRVLRNESTGGLPGCDLWHRGACGDLLYDYYIYLEGDIEMPAESFEFWAKHVDGLFRQAYVLVPHREEPFEGQQKLTECIRSPMVDHLAQTRALKDTVGADELYPDPRDRIYLQPPVPYTACLLMSRWQFEVYRMGKAWDYDTVKRTLEGGKIREAAIRGLFGDSRLTKLRAVTHLRAPVLHQQPMTGSAGLYPYMCNVDDYREKAAHCLRDACPAL
eukprot:CAMPEP_0179153824 /NCGR_PEP_ID=MMETSP0796-20121207/74827_1 /TAXON_ID=73915 /ORGANISM="Pyrodinium bahamense, Strain pbaha01" /LENGTH=600 /DNA_ID=CAMNT_0020855143 /DNA_START=245 /DNA_END=2047 /DNA_ORIENTATION=+